MKELSMLPKILHVASYAKANFEIFWGLSWATMNPEQEFANVLKEHKNFFIISKDAHFTASIIYLWHLFDNNEPKAPSFFRCLNEIKNKINSNTHELLCVEYEKIYDRAKPLVTRVRHNTVAHFNCEISEKDIFNKKNKTWVDVYAIFNDSAKFAEKLAKESGVSIENVLTPPPDFLLRADTENLLHALNSHIFHKMKV
jgi:hypothetical protein